MSRVTLLAPGDVVRACEAELAQRFINVRIIAWEEVVEGNPQTATNISPEGGNAHGGIRPKDVRGDTQRVTDPVRHANPQKGDTHADDAKQHASSPAGASSDSHATSTADGRHSDSRVATDNQSDGAREMESRGAVRTDSDTSSVEKKRKNQSGAAVCIPEGRDRGAASGSGDAHPASGGGEVALYVADQRIRDGLAGEVKADIRVFSASAEIDSAAIFLILGPSILKSLGVTKDSLAKQKDAQARIRRLEKSGAKIEIRHYESLSTLCDEYGAREDNHARTVRSGVVLVTNDPSLAQVAPVVFTVPTGDTTWKNTMRTVTSRRNVRVYRGKAAEAKSQLLALVDAI
ncbi:helicase [Chobar Gorge virus]|uniref:Helicase n=1 Tax=Chobar Gorge virus TaxID=1679172 RepID=A0A0H4M6T3_9REOV|nr:helicase [Chobar Gorge virus]AKP24105.1 helicase [Chobar Gorge virus]